MVLPDIKALKELLKLLRSQGVLQYQSVDLTMVLSELPPQPLSQKSRATEVLEAEEEQDEIAEMERLLFYSSTKPSDDIK
jgi:hypothetical protein